MKLKRIFFSVVVVLIVVAFVFSFFASGIAANRASDAQEQEATQQVDEEINLEQDEALSPFLQTIKNAMVQNDDATVNAKHIADAINVYNSLKADDKIAIEAASYGIAAKKLADFGIYFDTIDTQVETLAWQMIEMEDGFAKLK